MTRRWLNVENLLWLSLALALAGSLKHLANVFSLVDGDILLGWLQAIAIDIGLFALAYSIKIRRVAGRDARPLWVGVILFSAISIYGNLAYGLLAIEGVLPIWILVSKPYVLAASLPILVIFLSELLSENYHYLAGSMSKNTDISNTTPKVDKLIVPTSMAHTINISDTDNITTRRQQVKTLKHKMTQAAIAKELGVSLSTVRKDIKVLSNGKH